MIIYLPPSIVLNLTRAAEDLRGLGILYSSYYTEFFFLKVTKPNKLIYMHEFVQT